MVILSFRFLRMVYLSERIDLTETAKGNSPHTSVSQTPFPYTIIDARCVPHIDEHI